ncbi:MAG TPA: pYEATS domain-containing protein [Candidatus Angelobacter sp.]|nr:pYEATS domain-containing protein [Candidatus Angelobacter sp.]
MALSIRQNSRYLGKDRWEWSVWLEGTTDELQAVDHVVYILDSTFHNPVRVIKDRNSSFRLDTSGWGTFTIHAKAVDHEGHETLLRHDLVLLYPDGKPTVA